MPGSKLQIEPAETFGLQIEELRTAPEGSEVFSALLQALIGFRSYDFLESFPTFYSASEDLYVYRFHPRYLLTLRRQVETARGRPDTVILRLWTIEKA